MAQSQTLFDVTQLDEKVELKETKAVKAKVVKEHVEHSDIHHLGLNAAWEQGFGNYIRNRSNKI